MASTVVEEDIVGKVVQVKKKGKEGEYQAKVVQYKNKDYEVGKNYKDQVTVGKEYHFKLTKSEFNDKLYYWANLIEKGLKSEGDTPNQSETPAEDTLKKQVFKYLEGLDKDKKKAVINYLIERL